MRKINWVIFGLATILLVFNLQACGSIQLLIQGTATFTPAPTFTPSLTSTPTSTPLPTSTRTPKPNPEATEFSNRKDLMDQEIQQYVNLGYLSDSIGTYKELPNFEGDWAKVSWYQWQWTSFSGSDFVVSAFFRWNTANSSIYVSGCGLAIGPQSLTPQVFILHRSTVVALNPNGRDSKILKGTGHVDIPAPLAADFTLIVNSTEKVAYVLVDGEFVGKYQLERAGPVTVGYVIFSGTSTDYGTHCEITDARVWKIR